MTTAGPPSPASYNSDWGNGPRFPPKNGPPGPAGYSPGSGGGSGGGGGGGRANLPTPPVSGSSNGSMMNGGPPPPGPGGHFMPMGGPPPRADSRGPGGPGHPSPPQSLGRLSVSSNHSMRDPETARRRQMMMEDQLFQHFNVLRHYLAKDLGNLQEGRSKKARDKLLRLSPIQFHELSTDIYDELRRRQNQHRAPPNSPNFLMPRENFHPKRNQARQKLSTLMETRFRDLATDVFYELKSRFPRFVNGGPPPNGMGPPSRTGTPMGYRGHTPRQDSMASTIVGADGIIAKSTQGNTIVPNKSYLVEDDDEADMDSIYGGNRRDTTATNRSFGGGKVVAEYQSKIESLEEKVESLEAQMKEKEEELEKARSEGTDGEEAEELRRSLEEKLSGAQALNRGLQEEIDNLRAEHDRTQAQLEEANQQGTDVVALRSQHDDLLTDHNDLKETHEDLQKQHDALQRQLKESSGGGEWRVRCEDLETENQNLRRSVQEQQQVAKEVKVEASGFLAEMKAMMEQSNQGFKREEGLIQRNTLLESEIQEWKDRYARAKAQVRSTKTASIGLANQQPAIGQNMRAPTGLIRDLDITKFQVGVDDALKTARSGEAHELIDKVKDVVAAVRPMVRAAANVSDPKAVKARNKLTATVNNFITAGRNFAQSGGISPVSLVDAAASHLSSAIVELAVIVKIRPAGSSEGDDEDLGASLNATPAPLKPAPLQVQQQKGLQQFQQQQQQSGFDLDDDEDSEDDPTAGYYSDTPANGTPIESGGELLPSTTYQLPSTIYQPQAAPTRKPVGSGARPDTNGYPNGQDLTELKHFLDDQTSALITSIQSLVTSIRGSAPASEVIDHLATIVNTSDSILKRTSDAVTRSSSSSLKTQAGPLISTLEQSFAKLQAKEDEGERVSEGTPEYKKWCQGVPPAAFEIARVVKDLGGKVRAAVANDGGDEDFS